MEKYLIENYDQLKVISDSLRVKIVIMLIEKEMTVTEIGKETNLPKAKVFYHLKELEKFGMISITRKEEVKGNVYKYYRATHKGFEVDQKLLPHLKEDIGSVHNTIIMQQLENAKMVIAKNINLINGKNSISQTRQIKCTEEEFKSWMEEYNKLMTKYDNLEDGNNSKTYYINTVGIEVENEIFQS
ncbi:hypothetical protein BKP56_01500 [Marinilactibacillus sp. 15R]|uniref:winged helix-turn-helix domain-containing protein n=1 Tax=Marinilactibacillus sp. 15R TaxID=1911586 RepID=UPI00090C21F6|nr:winged helix-turn-helix domain-containing protein [Marinilactibacillus sp. 15R]API88082.1 hypothetical protein BKP56_01500 [Marinilactibacillus sp. 15R]